MAFRAEVHHYFREATPEVELFFFPRHSGVQPLLRQVVAKRALRHNTERPIGEVPEAGCSIGAGKYTGSRRIRIFFGMLTASRLRCG